ncbi:MAG: methyltransferase domain-containing protein [Erysipelotrichaceae bacterium]|jgi:23S rRNA (guanine745-N1)-methyltransferase|nr:methyltransferase domain-containing protein [Erysipelotrichaceae bacterium]
MRIPLRCPVCQEPLKKEAHRFICPKGHSFDIARQGYVNLLLKQSDKHFGDAPEMILARHAFLHQNYYQPLYQYLTNHFHSCKGSLLDIGCGEGYFTNALCQNQDLEVYGVDISKKALQIAARELPAQFIVAASQNLPFFANSFDEVISLFTPVDLNEIIRVLKPGGSLTLISPGPKHLLELRQCLYETIKEKQIKEINQEILPVVKQDSLTYFFDVQSSEDLNNLCQMTPFYKRTSQRQREKLKQTPLFTITADFLIRQCRKINE